MNNPGEGVDAAFGVGAAARQAEGEWLRGGGAPGMLISDVLRFTKSRH